MSHGYNIQDSKTVRPGPFNEAGFDQHGNMITKGELKDINELVDSNNFATRMLTDGMMACSTSFMAILMIYFLCLFEEMGEGRIFAYFGCTFCSRRATSNALKVAEVISCPMAKERPYTLVWGAHEDGPPACYSQLLPYTSECSNAAAALEHLCTIIHSRFFLWLQVALVGAFWSVSFACYLSLAHEREKDPAFNLFDQVGADCRLGKLNSCRDLNMIESECVCY